MGTLNGPSVFPESAHVGSVVVVATVLEEEEEEEEEEEAFVTGSTCGVSCSPGLEYLASDAVVAVTNVVFDAFVVVVAAAAAADGVVGAGLVLDRAGPRPELHV